MCRDGYHHLLLYTVGQCIVATRAVLLSVCHTIGLHTRPATRSIYIFATTASRGNERKCYLHTRPQHRAAAAVSGEDTVTYYFWLLSATTTV